MVMVAVLVPPAGIVAGTNALEMFSCWTLSTAWAGKALVTPWAVVTAPAGMVLI